MNVVATLINGHSERMTTLLGGQKFSTSIKFRFKISYKSLQKGDRESALTPTSR